MYFYIIDFVPIWQFWHEGSFWTAFSMHLFLTDLGSPLTFNFFLRLDITCSVLSLVQLFTRLMAFPYPFTTSATRKDLMELENAKYPTVLWLSGEPVLNWSGLPVWSCQTRPIQAFKGNLINCWDQGQVWYIGIQEHLFPCGIRSTIYKLSPYWDIWHCCLIWTWARAWYMSVLWRWVASWFDNSVDAYVPSKFSIFSLPGGCTITSWVGCPEERTRFHISIVHAYLLSSEFFLLISSAFRLLSDFRFEMICLEARIGFICLSCMRTFWIQDGFSPSAVRFDSLLCYQISWVDPLECVPDYKSLMHVCLLNSGYFITMGSCT